MGVEAVRADTLMRATLRSPLMNNSAPTCRLRLRYFTWDAGIWNHTHTHSHACTRTHTRTHTLSHMCIHTHTHTCARTHTHTHACTLQCFRTQASKTHLIHHRREGETRTARTKQLAQHSLETQASRSLGSGRQGEPKTWGNSSFRFWTTLDSEVQSRTQVNLKHNGILVESTWKIENPDIITKRERERERARGTTSEATPTPFLFNFWYIM